ncbi:hypothetical protein Pan241w_24360 [Gimesia alba]|uniref:Uncharacterized protein n=1 Tax=Gimesia alba TaxID=2527973 RepID=A0A517REQ2_9PLAN|nr:hypothetical protein [Gimesia alba]QDT42353.1 hypothetical protein Pan241w_24360 [Gimesia alba]
MSMTPFEDDPVIQQEEEQLVIQRTDLAPIEKNDPPSRYQRFLNQVRLFLGMKPLDLARRFTEARVRKEEIENEVKLIQAKADYELKMAEAVKLRAEANQIKSEIKLPESDSDDPQLATMLQNHTPEEAMKKLQDIIDQIQIQHGGQVDLKLPKSISEPDGTDSD